MKLLIDESPLIVLPSLASQLGLNEAIVFQQAHFWLTKTKYEFDGRKWFYKSYECWQQEFPFWSIATIRRIIQNLERQGLLISTNEFNTYKLDRTKWYTINYEKYNQLLENQWGKDSKKTSESNNPCETAQDEESNFEKSMNKLEPSFQSESAQNKESNCENNSEEPSVQWEVEQNEKSNFEKLINLEDSVQFEIEQKEESNCEKSINKLESHVQNEIEQEPSIRNAEASFQDSEANCKNQRHFQLKNRKPPVLPELLNLNKCSNQHEQSNCSGCTHLLLNLNCSAAQIEHTNNHRIIHRIITENYNNTATNKGAEQPTVFAFYEQNGFGTLSPYIAEKIGTWIDDLNEQLVLEAMKRAVENNVRNFRYVETILKNWHNKNYQTIDEIKAERKPLIKKRNKETIPQWFYERNQPKEEDCDINFEEERRKVLEKIAKLHEA